MRPILFLLFICLCHTGRSQYDAALKYQIDSMITVDQALRTDLLKYFIESKKAPDSLRHALRRCDSLNLLTAKTIINTKGFPSSKLVSMQTSESFTGLVIHFDDDIAFQKQVLSLMAKQLKNKTVPVEAFAILTDRIAVNEGRKQWYGTQTVFDNSTIVLAPVEDSINVDRRRKAIGLKPVHTYLKELTERLKNQ
jgi:hypothetical protein